jgi:hypothetical protein
MTLQVEIKPLREQTEIAERTTASHDDPQHETPPKKQK